MLFEWDENKDRANQSKHGVGFETVKLVFDDPLHISLQNHSENGEERWRTLGLAGGVVLLVVAHTYRGSDGGEVLRIISARKAAKRERNSYERGD
jgi:uncharacterized DUF497 family protein